MSEPLEILVRAALDAARPIAKQLRERGWDAQLRATAPTAGHRIVSIEIHLDVRIPIEAQDA